MNFDTGFHYDGSVDRSKDPIWDTPVIEVLPTECQGTKKYNSPRCGGWYSIHDTTTYKIRREWSDREKARLTSWLVEQRRLGNECPEITENVIKSVKQQKNMPISDRADAVLRYIQLETHELGESLSYDESDPANISDILSIDPSILPSVIWNLMKSEEKIAYYNLIVFSECVSSGELTSLMKYLEQNRWIEYKQDQHGDGHHTCSLTVKGHARLVEVQQPKTESPRGFMAMWFHSSMDQAWQKGFEPGIREAGCEPVRIDQKQHVNKIDDEVRAEIRRAQFVVADLTGDRGGVYYEAGFAHGLGIPVVFTRRKDSGETHFDLRQYNCIFWQDNDLKKLQEDLANRITVILGDGPGRSAS